MAKKIKIFIIITVIILGIFLILIGTKKVLANKKTDTVTYHAKVEEYENVIDISGTVSAAQEQTLKALSAGTVTKVYVKAGDKVKKGDIILQLDDTEQRYNLEKQEYSMAQKKVSGSAKELKLMETERAALVRKINDRKVLATFDGIIADLDVAVGDSLDAKDVVGTLVNVDYLTAEVEITETDVGKLEINQKVEFSFPAYPGKKVNGYVISWPAIGEITSRGATIVKAKIKIDDYPKEILPNYSFTGKIEISPAENYVVVEKYAIGYDEFKQPYVELKNGEKKKVTIKPFGREYVKVLSGLNGGEELKQLTAPAISGKNAKGMKSSRAMVR